MKLSIKMEFKKKKLTNGMTLLFEKRDLPLVSVSISNKFGGAYEDSEIKGIAHFIEHLVFTGTKTRSHEDISREIEKKGGILNAFTAHEVTSFWFKLPKEHLKAGMNILSDILNNPRFEKEKFDKEKKVVLEEIKMYHDSPQRFVFEMIEKNMYEKPFGELVIGNEKSVSGLDRDHVANYFTEAYNPENFIVTVVGDADFEEVCSYLEKNFDKKDNKKEIKEIKKKNGRSIEERPGIDQAHFILGMHAPLPSTKEFADLEVMDAYLANGMSSKLFLEIREKRGLAYAVKSMINSEKSYSGYLIYVGTMKDKVEEVEKIILEEFGKIGEMTEKDLEEAKERLIGLRHVAREDSSDVMNELLFSELRENAENYYKYEEEVMKVTLEDVKRLAGDLIKEYSTATVVPK
jgi:predicted Zn-dependent peptidase